uniref:TonB-dependent receptor domain-containing protein n=1 Tax=uncultured Sphingomonas sp. TaxID=158754 RepID=UPI0035CBDA54
MRFRTSHATLTGGASALAVGLALLSTPVLAQTAAPDAATPVAAAPDGQAAADAADAPSDIVVTGSRIDRAGFTAPSPTLRVTAADLSVGGRSNIGAALNDLPQFRATSSAQTTGTNTGAGNAPVDLRGLGIARTLVLIDGRRFVGDNDLNAVPTVMVRSVDVVTGGASAAWGSGAVAGVVNIGVDEKFTGLKLGVQGGISSYKDAGERRAEGEFGTAFAGGRGHFVIGGEYLDNDGVVPKTSRPNVGRWATVSDGLDANGKALFKLVPDVGFANAAYGGLILSGVNSGKAFNTDGSLRTFDGGTISGTNSIGGEGPSNDDLSPLVTPQRRYSGLARVTYDVTPTIKATVEGRYSRMYNNYTWFGDNNRGNLTISSDNAFLSPAIKAQMAAAGQSSFTFGRFNDDFAYSTIDFQRKTWQGTFALDGTIGNHLRWSGYYSHGELDTDIKTPGFILTSNYANAVDSVISPTTGQAVCRIALTNPTTNCVPINLFGDGSPSAAAKAYVTGTPESRSRQTLDVGGISLRGEPITLPAGDVSFAVGIEARHEYINTTVGALDAAKAFTTFSFAPLEGGFTVKEAFGELSIPLIHNTPLLRQLDINAAIRVSDYSTTGSIWSWKVGATNEFFPGFRGRIMRSRDIRSANLTELYTQSTTGYNTLTDPQTGQSVYVQSIGGGNVNLRPEIGTTWTGGFSYSPPAIPRLNMSVDYYDIKIKDVITTIAAQDLVTRCYNGNTALCAQIDRDASGTLIRTRATYVNLSQYKTDGIDAEMSYVLPVASVFAGSPGNFRFRAIGTWVDSMSTNDGVSTIEYVRSQGYSFGLGVPKWRVNGSIGYDGPTYALQVRARYISPGNYNSTVNIVNNHIDAYTYFDLQASTKIPTLEGRSMEIYMNVTNLFDKDPPISSLYSPYYDVIGRYITVGARIKI